MHKQSNTIRKEILRVLSETDISKLITEFNAGQSEPFSEFGKKNIVINSHPLTAVITP
jgi:hypothetical protein